MNNLSKAILRLTSNVSLKTSLIANSNRDYSRMLWHMSPAKNDRFKSNKNYGLQMHSGLAMNYTCNARSIHTKGERELVEFLTEEILAERKAQKIKTVPTTLDGFQVRLDGAEMELRKENDKEKIVINFNVNHTVDQEDEPEIDLNADKPEVGEMRSKPKFEVDIIKGRTTLSFTCSYLEGLPQEGEYNDVFGIDELTIFEGEWNDKVYAVAGDVLDGHFYDLLMNFLEEKGISNEFAEKMSEMATAYEHSSYIALLESLSKFTTGNLKAAAEKENRA